PVERRGRSAALDVSEDRDAGLEPGAVFDLLGDPVADAAELLVAELVLLSRRSRDLASDGLRALRDDDDGELLALLLAGLNRGADVVDVERLLGDQAVVGAARDRGDGG